MIKKIYNRYGKFIRFCIVGATNTVISLIVYSLFIFMNIHYIWASCVGYIAGIANGYILSSKFVFKEKLDKEKGFKFILIYASSLLINLTIVTVLIEKLGLNEIVAQVLATGFNVIYNYLLNSIFTFKNKQGRSE
ncbi:MAG: GtrA family protein [Cellulosilyticaceae bacterium]